MKTRADRAAALLDECIRGISKQLKDGNASAAILHECIALAKSCGVDLTCEGQPLSRPVDSVLASLRDIDPKLLVPDPYSN